MSIAMKDKSDKDDLKEIPIGIKWEWDDTNKCLTFKNNITLSEKNDKKKKNRGGKIDLRSGVPRLVKQDRQRNEVMSRSDLRKQASANITVSDVKNAALNMVSERYFIPSEFECFCNDKNTKLILEDFLLNLANYFYWFFEKIDASIVTNPRCIERSKPEQDRINNAENMIKITLKSLAKGYCMLILGLGSDEYHHMHCGKIKASSSFRDRGLYETMYPFCVFFIWITFSRRDYEIIRQEIGRMLKSEAFNNSVKIESLLEEDNEKNGEKAVKIKANDSKGILKQFESNKMSLEEQKNFVKRPAPATILLQRSPAVVSLLPLPQEKSKKLFDRKAAENIKEILDDDREEALNSNENGNPYLMLNVGVIGQPTRLYNMKTLAPRGTVEDEQEGASENKTETMSTAGDRQASHLATEADNKGDAGRTLSQMSRPTTVASVVSNM